MAENQSIKKEDTYWHRVVLRWVKCAELNPSQDYIDLTQCYDNFRNKIKQWYDIRETTVGDFLRAKFPHFELKLGKENEIPESDHVYVFSLLLYFSCVELSIPYFQNIGLAFEEPYQYSMKAFLNAFVPESENKVVIDRSFLDKAFLNAKRSTNVLREQCSSNLLNIQSKGKQTQSKQVGNLETSKPCSPTKPNTGVLTALEWKVKNLTNLLDSARAENVNQEKQIEQLLRNVQELQREKKRNLAKISALQQKEPCSCVNSSAELTHRISRVTEQLQKQLESKNNCIELLQEEIAKAKETANKEAERTKTVKKQCVSLKEDNHLLTMTVEALQEELTLKDSINQNLMESVGDLRRFIRENRIHGAGMMDSFESSFELSENSLRLPTPDASMCNDSENLAATVVDIKLKEKERENEALEKRVQELEEKLKDLYKTQSEKLARQEAEASQKLSELRRSLDETEMCRIKLADSLEREKAKTEDLNRRTEEWKVQQKRGTKELERLTVLYEEKQCQYEKSLLDCDKLWVKLYKARSTLEDNEKRWTQERACLKKLFEDTVQVLELKLHKSKIECQAKMEEMAERMKQQHEEISNKLESDKKRLFLEVDDHRKTIENLEGHCTLLQKELAESLKANQLLQNELKTAKEIYSVRKSSVEQSTQTNLRPSIDFNKGEMVSKVNPRTFLSKHSALSGSIDDATVNSDISQRSSKLVPKLEPIPLASEGVSKAQDGIGRCTGTVTRRDSAHVMVTKPSDRIGNRKGVQRKVLFDSNRNLIDSPPTCQQDFVGVKSETNRPLNSLSECPLSNEVLKMEASVALIPPRLNDKEELLLPTTPTSRTTTDNLLSTKNTISSTTTANTVNDPSTSPVVRDYRFSQPYGSNRYNILRMQVQSRSKRQQLCDQTRKLAAKRRSNSLSSSFGSPAARLRKQDHNKDAESCSDVTLYLSFTHDPDTDELQQQQQQDEQSRTTSLFLVFIAYIGMLAQLFFFFGGLAITTKRLKGGRT